MRAPLCLALALQAAPLAGQIPRDLAADRLAFSQWLASAPATPATILALSPISPGQALIIGPDSADLPIPGFDSAQVQLSNGALLLEGKTGLQAVPHTGQLRRGAFLVAQAGPPNRRMLLIYGTTRRPIQPDWYPFSASMVFTTSLDKSEKAESRTLLDLDGVEASATLAGSVALKVAGIEYRLRVYRFGGPDDEEQSLEIYFQDATNDAGTYPAGRFVELRSLPDGRYQLDFNRARNPFCAYRTVYPCPIPWPGNLIKTPIAAGERYVHSQASP
jgi:uncharacterized protein (DUF1684 family)